MSADPPRVFPVDDFVREELYPGYRQAFGSQPFVAGPVRPFSLADNERYWLRDSLHFSEGMVPASIATLDDAQTWGAQLGAEIVGVPPTRGSVNRLAGTHVYIGTIDVDTQWQVQARAARFGQYVSPILADFGSYWSMRAAELTAAYEHFDHLDLSAMSPAELWTALKDAYAFHRRAWFIHFEVMYVLTANYLAFYALAEEIGLSGSQVSSFLSGQQTFYSRTDEELWRLAGLARSLGVDAALTQGSPADMRVAGAGAARRRFVGGRVRRVPGRLRAADRGDLPDRHAVLDRGPVSGAVLDRRVPGQAGRVRLPRRPGGRDRGTRRADRGGAALGQRVGPDPVQRGAGVEPGRQLRLVERGAQLPDRPAGGDPGAPGDARARRAAGRGGADPRPDDMFYLFKPELFEVMESGGESRWAELAAMIPDRRAYFEHWRERGPSLPTMLGTIPDTVPDPIMIEVFGLSGHFLETLRGEPRRVRAAGAEIRGFPAAKGVAEGVARVITTVTDLHTVQPGEVLVCGGTTTEWTPAFGIILACVCDTGGSLTHAAIVSREYGIPCVVGTAVATTMIKTGDRVRVDGRAGTVQVLA